MFNKLTTAVKWDTAAFSVMEGDPYVCSAMVDLSEGQRSHITPVLEGGADGHVDQFLLHVRCVVDDAVGQTPLSPATCKRTIPFFF